MIIEQGQVWRCKNNNIIKIAKPTGDTNPAKWMWEVWEVEIIAPDVHGGYNVTGDGKFWEEDEDTPDDLETYLPKEEFPEYYL